MQIIDGYVGAPNIYADVIGEHNISMYGSGDYVLNVGECLGYELISNNEIRIKDGMFITQGRRGYIKKGTTEVCRIDNGAQSGKRNDLIVIEYAKDLSTQVESHTIRVLKGIPGAEASDPEITTGNIPDGAILHQMPLYRVKIEGLSVAAIEQMFEIGSVAAETVNPMLATEPGFAADAYQTKLQLESCFQSVSNGKALVASAITGKGVTTDSDAAFSTMANNIINIKDVANNTPGTATPDMLTEGFTAWVNGKLIVGTRPLGAKRLSGTVTHGAGWGDVVTNTIKFATPFDTIPTVSLAGSKCTEHDFDQLYVGSVNTTGFTYVFEPGGTPGLGHSTVVINWVAYV